MRSVTGPVPTPRGSGYTWSSEGCTTHSSHRGGLPGRGLSPGPQAPLVAGSTHTASSGPATEIGNEESAVTSRNKSNASNPGVKTQATNQFAGRPQCGQQIATVAKEIKKKILKSERLMAGKLAGTLLALGRQNVV